MSINTKIKFFLVNGVSKKDVSSNKYVIYAHLCKSGVYVGVTNNPVKRWQEHVSDALNKDSHNYKDKFRESIRTLGSNTFKHYILAVSNSLEAAKSIEASAIRYYGKNLNTRNEIEINNEDYDFSPLQNQIGTSLLLDKKGRTGATYSRDDSARRTITGEIYIENGRKRVRSIQGQPFPAGLNIECSRNEREKYNPGDKVRVNVAISEKSDGKQYLVAGKTSPLNPVR